MYDEFDDTDWSNVCDPDCPCDSDAFDDYAAREFLGEFDD